MQKKDLTPPFPDQIQPQEHYPQPREVSENLRTTGTPSAQLPDRKPGDLLRQHPFGSLVFDTDIYLLP